MIHDLWYKNTVIYSLDLETFMDGNGDGVGDFTGLINRLDYLHSLGIGAIWLAPFQPTPNQDNGYDISDYYGVDPRHGTSGDFVEFVHEARERGLRVLMDLVANHTSDQHPWFQAARAHPDSKYRDYYVWSEKRPKDWDEGMVFPGPQKATWTKDKKAGLWYLHHFYDFQPDLNFDNPEVRAEMRRVIGYWLQLGVGGFRVDAVPFILESKSAHRKSKMRFDYLTEIRRFLQWRSRDAILLGEANVLPPDHLKYFNGGGDGIHLMFNFWVNQHLFYALASGEVGPLIDALHATKELPPNAQWAHFLRNHDELDIDRLTGDQKAAVFAQFGPEQRMQLYERGIRRRLAPMLGTSSHLELAYSMLFSLPGTPVIRYGDEIGMGDDLSLKERAAVRTPMHWADEPQGGFTTAKNPVHPVISEGPYSSANVNVAQQRRDPDSLLNWTSRMIRLRKECPEVGSGDWQVLKTGSPSVLAMRYEWQGSALVILHNFANKPQEARIRLRENGSRLVNLMVNDDSQAERNGIHRIGLEARGYRWFREGGLGYAVHRHEHAESSAPKTSGGRR